MSETSPPDDQLTEYLNRIVEFSKLINFIDESYKASTGTTLGRNGSLRTSASCTIGPIKFQVNKNPKANFLADATINSSVSGHNVLGVHGGVQFLMEHYLVPPPGLVDCVRLSEELKYKVKNFESSFSSKVAAAVNDRLHSIQVERKATPISCVACEYNSELINNMKIKKVKELLCACGITLVSGYFTVIVLITYFTDFFIKLFFLR